MADVIVQWGSRKYIQEIRSDGHLWWADEPREVGGQDAGPTPYQLLLSALGACTAITLRMYAERKQWPLRSVQVQLQQKQIHAKDCQDCESEEGFITEISLKLQLQGDLSREQRERLLEIAGKCPVKKTLSGEIKIRSELI